MLITLTASSFYEKVSHKAENVPVDLKIKYHKRKEREKRLPLFLKFYAKTLK